MLSWSCACRHEVERRTHPLSKADFALLESELESWRQQQTAAIKNAGLVHQEEQVSEHDVLRLRVSSTPASHTTPVRPGLHNCQGCKAGVHAHVVCVRVQAALQLLLAKETRLLHTLDKLRMAAHQEKQAMGRQVLGALAQPKAWPLSNGKKVC